MEYWTLDAEQKRININWGEERNLVSFKLEL